MTIDERNKENRMQVLGAINGKLPASFGRNEDIPKELVGSRILGFGSFSDRPREGGLVIDYLTAQNEKRRVVFSFNELAMWVSDGDDFKLEDQP